MAAERFLVLGSNSFSGATFCDYLVQAGHDVLATSRSLEPATPMLPYRWGEHAAHVEFHRVDINHDLDALAALMMGRRPTHVVNFAAQSMVGESWANPDHWMTTNVVSTVKLVEMLRRFDFLDRYVHITTPEVYGSTEGWVREDHAFRPSTPYAVSRAAGDMYLRAFHETTGFPVVSTRAANVYGPGQQLYRIVPRTIYAAMTGEKLKLDGGGKSVRVFIHMRDVSDATLRIAQRGVPGDTYHISGYELVSIRKLVEMILAELGHDFDACVEIGPDRPGKDSAYTLDSGKLRNELGWSDKIDLHHGIADVIVWAERFANELPMLPKRYEHKP